mmetsp:Transcript_30667/g.99742  ORF Transcript_30667/g.99742 Transcript_30667/m.99742 type:complete len:223 (-) Transcript_30667:680-1348(-)
MRTNTIGSSGLSSRCWSARRLCWGCCASRRSCYPGRSRRLSRRSGSSSRRGRITRGCGTTKVSRNTSSLWCSITLGRAKAFKVAHSSSPLRNASPCGRATATIPASTRPQRPNSGRCSRTVRYQSRKGRSSSSPTTKWCTACSRSWRGTAAAVGARATLSPFSWRTSATLCRSRRGRESCRRQWNSGKRRGTSSSRASSSPAASLGLTAHRCTRPGTDQWRT